MNLHANVTYHCCGRECQDMFQVQECFNGPLEKKHWLRDLVECIFLRLGSDDKFQYIHFGWGDSLRMLEGDSSTMQRWKGCHLLNPFWCFCFGKNCPQKISNSTPLNCGMSFFKAPVEWGVNVGSSFPRPCLDDLNKVSQDIRSWGVNCNICFFLELKHAEATHLKDLPIPWALPGLSRCHFWVNFPPRNEWIAPENQWFESMNFLLGIFLSSEAFAVRFRQEKTIKNLVKDHGLDC